MIEDNDLKKNNSLIEILQSISIFIKETGQQSSTNNKYLCDLFMILNTIDIKVNLIMSKLNLNNSITTCEHSGISWDKEGKIV